MKDIKYKAMSGALSVILLGVFNYTWELDNRVQAVESFQALGERFTKEDAQRFHNNANMKLRMVEKDILTNTVRSIRNEERFKSIEQHLQELIKLIKGRK